MSDQDFEVHFGGNNATPAAGSRILTTTNSTSDVIVFGKLEIDYARYEIRVGKIRFRPTPTEFRLLITLAESPGRVYSRHELLAASRGEDAISDHRSIDVHVKNLRTKLGEHAQLVETIRGFGYCLREI